MTRNCKSIAECNTGNGMYFNSEYNAFVAPVVILACHAGYIVTILALKAFMKNRKAFGLDIPMKLYNFIQIALSVLLAVKLVPNLQLNILNNPFCADTEYWIFIHYLSKYLDMFDSVWMVLRKKDVQLTFLHLYHHLTIGMIWGFLLNDGVGNGAAFFGAFLNSAVHALMYFHDFVTSFGIKNPLKKYLTQVQMAQFAMCIQSLNFFSY